MVLDDGFTDVPAGRIAAVVTYLQMLAPAPLRGEHGTSDLTLHLVGVPTADWYKALYAYIGSQDWLWFSRLKWADSELEDIIQNPLVEVYTLHRNGSDEGLLELDFRVARSCELAFFGVSRKLLGSGAGRYLMNRAIERAWARDIDRFHVHTCTMDHPAALEFYIRSGFLPYKRQIEVAPDPRLEGVLPMSAAPHVPIIGEN
jgi:GNAT superfamily N-acetyltransferase